VASQEATTAVAEAVTAGGEGVEAAAVVVGVAAEAAVNDWVDRVAAG